MIAIAALEDVDYYDKMRKESNAVRDWFIDELNTIEGVKAFKSGSNYVFIRLDAADAVEASALKIIVTGATDGCDVALGSIEAAGIWNKEGVKVACESDDSNNNEDQEDQKENTDDNESEKAPSFSNPFPCFSTEPILVVLCANIQNFMIRAKIYREIWIG